MVLVIDINNGFYVLQFDFKRVCWLEGIVWDFIIQAFINGVMVVIDFEQFNFGEFDLFGVYVIGQVLVGIFVVIFEKFGYQLKILQVDLDNGVFIELDVDFVFLQQYFIIG